MKFILTITLFFSLSSFAFEKMTVFKSPSCGCCTKWVKHMRENGFDVKEVVTTELGKLKNKYRVPKDKRSCHTAVMNGKVFEGHIPASSIKKFLNSGSKAIGLVVPDMPLGSPGMEHGKHKENFTVYTFSGKGKVEEFEKF